MLFDLQEYQSFLNMCTKKDLAIDSFQRNEILQAWLGLVWFGLRGNGSNDESYLKFMNSNFLFSFIWNLSLE